MRIDKYMKVSRLIKRREAAKQMLDLGRIYLNGRLAKPASEIKAGDEISVVSPTGKKTVLIVKEVRPISSIKDAAEMYEIIDRG